MLLRQRTLELRVYVALYLALLLLVPPPASLAAVPPSSGSKTDAELLLAFKDTFTNAEKILEGWNGTEPCNGVWMGITCKQSRVTRIGLQNGKLEGTIPSPWGWELPSTVTVLDLYDNRIGGTIPPGWRLPPQLEKLNIGINPLVGNLPEPSWALPDTIRNLDISELQISGTIPATWRLPAALVELQMFRNKLSGTIPVEFITALPRSLNSLGLWKNQLSGTLPSFPVLQNASLYVYPGNAGLCGEVPTAPQYWFYDYETGDYNHTRLLSLPNCGATPASAAPAEDTGGAGAAVIAGAVAGSVGCAVVLGILGWCCLRQRRKKTGDKERRSDDEAMSGKGSGNLSTNPLSQASTEPGSQSLGKVASSDKDEALRILTDPFLASVTARLASTDSGGVATPRLDSSMARIPSNDSSFGSAKIKVDVKMWGIPFNDLQLVRQIGRGSFGRVYLAEWRGDQVAVKILMLGAERNSGMEEAAEAAMSLSNPVLANLQQEAKVMAVLRHPNILLFMGVVTAPPCLVLEYCPRGSLYDILREVRASPTGLLRTILDWPRRLEMVTGAASGIAYLHSFNPPILHRDLRSPNLLVDKSWNIKVSDFNLCKIVEDGSSNSSVAVTNPRWLAPELLAGQRHTFASDVYAFGVILWELLTFQAPYEELKNTWQVVNSVMEGRRPNIPGPGQLPGGDEQMLGLDAYVQLIHKCWAQDPEDRPSFSDIVVELRKLLDMARGETTEPQNEVDPGLGSHIREPGAPLRRCVINQPDILSPFKQQKNEAAEQELSWSK